MKVQTIFCGFIVLLIAEIGFSKIIGIKGSLTCNGTPLKDAKIELRDTTKVPLSAAVTSSDGKFLVYGDEDIAIFLFSRFTCDGDKGSCEKSHVFDLTANPSWLSGASELDLGTHELSSSTCIH